MTEIKRMFLVTETSVRESNAGTDSPVTLVCSVGGRDRINYTIIDSPQLDLDRGQANLYEIPVPKELYRERLEDGSFRLEIRGGDWWRPRRVFVLAIDSRGGNHVIVSIPDWEEAGLSTDPRAGRTSFPLPLAK